MARKAPPPYSFPQSMHMTWKRAIEQSPVALSIECGEKSTAIALRHKLYILRKSLVEHGYAIGREAMKLKITILFSEAKNSFYLNISEPDTKFDEILANAGIIVEEAPSIGTLMADLDDTRDPDEYLSGPKVKKGAK